MMGGPPVCPVPSAAVHSMRLSSIPIPRLLAAAGAAYLAAIVVLVATKAPLGSAIFFAAVATGTIAYGAVLVRVWSEPRAPRRLLLAAFAVAVVLRVPMAVAPVGSDSDMVRYQWDGRVQLLGYSPYAVLPADPAMAHTHTDQTMRMPSRRDRTPYPPAAQLFFRLVVMISDSTLAMKLALVACDLLTIVVLWRWLAATGRSEWLTLAYAWNPLVVFEIAHSGHIDALAALWIVAAAFWLARRRTQLATIAFVLAIATKLVPIVPAPILLGRVRKRDALHGGAPARRALPAVPVWFGRPPRRRTERRRSHPFQRPALRRHRGSDVSAVRCRRRPGRRPVRRRLGTVAAARDRPGGLGVADGGRDRLRARHLPLVSALPDAVPVLDRHAAADGVDRERAVRVQGLGPLPPRRPMDHAHVGDGL